MAVLITACPRPVQNENNLSILFYLIPRLSMAHKDETSCNTNILNNKHMKVLSHDACFKVAKNYSQAPSLMVTYHNIPLVRLYPLGLNSNHIIWMLVWRILFNNDGFIV